MAGDPVKFWAAPDGNFHGYKLLVAPPETPDLSLFLEHINPGVGWDIPGGLLDNPIETPVQVALRETLEETGLDVDIEGVSPDGEFLYLDETAIDLPRGRLIRHIGRAIAHSTVLRFDCGPAEPEHKSGLWLPTLVAVSTLPMRENLRDSLMRIAA